MERREFIKVTGAAASLSLLPTFAFLRSAQAADACRLSWQAYRTVNFEGEFQVGQIEGTIPESLSGTLFRIGPGTKNNYGTALSHLFDGDAYVTSLKFENGQVRGQSAFLETPERAKEKQAQQMLYYEFGTKCPGTPLGFKNTPNIHIVNFGGRMMALSESSPPTEVDAETLEAKSLWDFVGTLPEHTTFTAHPRLDPLTGDGYTFGITQAMSPELKAFRFDSKSGQLTLIKSIALGGYYMIHDMMVTENYLVFLVPPISVDLMGAATLRAPVSELLRFENEKPLRIFIVKKDGSEEPLEFQSFPGGAGFHHVNAYEENGKIIFDTILAPDMGIMNLLKSWSQATLPLAKPAQIVRLELDLFSGQVSSRKTLSDGVALDFPCIDPGKVGQKQRHIYALEARFGAADPLNTNGLVCWDLETLNPTRVLAEPSRMFGEMVMVDSWLLNLGYDSGRDETFLEIRKPLTLEIETRVWMNRYIPLGFHGSFVRRV